MENTDVDQMCMLKNCYFYGGKMDGEFVSGVFRSGKIGEFGVLGDDVRIVTDTDSYFNTSVEDEETHKKSWGSKPKKLNPFQPRKF